MSDQQQKTPVSPLPHLLRLGLRDFRSYRKATLQLVPLTFLIGPNASGKTNLIEALRLLSWLADGRRLDDLTRSIDEADLPIRGRLDEIPRDGTSAFALSTHFLGERLFYANHHVEILADTETAHIVNEDLYTLDENVPLYQVSTPASQFSRDVSVSYNNFARGGRKPQITCTDQQLVLTQLRTPARFGANHRKSQNVIPAACETITRSLQSILFLDPSPRRMRGYSHRLDHELKSDGSNVSSALAALCENESAKAELLDVIRSIPEQDIESVRFIETPRNEVMISLGETFAGHRKFRDAPLLSDGTLRVLAIACAVMTATEGSLVVVEEVDNGVHPSRATHLLKKLLDVGKRRRVFILLTTHNPALLDAIPDEALPDVTCCYRDPDDGTSKLVRLGQLESYPRLMAIDSLGSLVSRGILESTLKAPPTKAPAEPPDDLLAALDEESAESQ